MTSEEVLPCPFCGNQPAATEMWVFGRWVYSVSCRLCKASPSVEGCISKDTALKEWNTRHESSRDHNRCDV